MSYRAILGAGAGCMNGQGIRYSLAGGDRLETLRQDFAWIGLASDDISSERWAI